MAEEGGKLAKKREALWLRARMIQAMRGFFIDRGYLEVETPERMPAPAPEDHIDAVPSGNWFLQTSPELCMKRLLAAGYDKIFQICKCYREGERGLLHLPEYTMIEWYRRDANYFDLMTECEELLSCAAEMCGTGKEGFLDYQGSRIFLQRPWEKISVAEAFRRYAPWPMADALARGCFDEMIACRIGPHLGTRCPTFLYDYPVSLGALAKAKASEPHLAERFELYVGGIELANAFSELTDPHEQRKRFEESLAFRRSAGKTVYPMPEPFLQDLDAMPEAAGIALGVDRLAMILTDSPSIDEVVAFAPEDL
ncbi:MAG: EF-P lysine aminoacylase GenX [Deltaproteobacteria bacterium]|nr:EF-P lysine aminoacylase GenX [Deltaproteobacteria bacterium]